MDTATKYVVAVLAGVLTVALVGPGVLGVAQSFGTTSDAQPTVAVVSFTGPTSDVNVDLLEQRLRQVRSDDSVAAVVLQVNSRGGPASSSEDFYLAVNRTAAEMPVVAYVEGTAASGGYYGIVPSDEIFVKPSSTVGSIGVIVSAPLARVEEVATQRESFVRTGPDKAQISKDGIRANLEQLQTAFLDSVMKHRGDELTLSRTQVSNGSTYLGAQAVQNGFADQIGGIEAAIEYAAAESDAISGDNYQVVYETTAPESVFRGVQGQVVDVNGSVVYVANTRADSEFVAPVRYYTVWGIPADANGTDVRTGVRADG